MFYLMYRHYATIQNEGYLYGEPYYSFRTFDVESLRISWLNQHISIDPFNHTLLVLQP